MVSTSDGIRWSRAGLSLGVGLTVGLVAGGLVVAYPAAADGPSTFSNTATVAIPATGAPGQIGPAGPYPSTISVSGMTGVVSAVSVRFNNLSHSSLNDVDAMLVAPSGANLVLLSDIGDPATLAFASNATLTFSDSAANLVPAGNVGTGSYKPTNTGAGDTFPAPAPSPSSQTTLAGAFTGATPNGNWQLYVVDDASGDVGSMAGGWSLIVTTTVSSALTTTTVTTSGSPSSVGSAVKFTASVVASGVPVTSGSVQFTDAATALGPPIALNASGVASLTTSALAEGTHQISAAYQGASGFLASNGVVSQRVDNITVVDGNTFCNVGVITVPSVGPASPYPSNLTVSGLTGKITKVTATLKGVSHTAPSDLDVALSGPHPATNVMLLSDSGGVAPASNVNLTFDDAAGNTVGAPLSTGTYRPTDDDTGGADSFPAPAPVMSGATGLSTFDDSRANGTWSLWLNDDAAGDSGQINGGWCVTVTTSGGLVADAGGPYTVGEGRSLKLDGSGSTSGKSYAWDLNNDGDFGDASTKSPTLSWTQLESLGIDNGPASHMVALRVTDGQKAKTASAELTVNNRAPTLKVTGKFQTVAGTEIRIRMRPEDPSSADQLRKFTYVVNWGVNQESQTVRDKADLTLTHLYPGAGNFMVRVTVRDRDGGKSQVERIPVVITS